jgi:ribosomal protein S12 methylthiotransferase
VKEERWHALMVAQRRISRRRLERRVGAELEVLVDAVDGDTALARSFADAPEIDGKVLVRGAAGAVVGAKLRVRIDSAGDYDLEAHPLPRFGR